MSQDKAIAAPAMGGREWAMLLALAALWGGSFFINAVADRRKRQPASAAPASMMASQMASWCVVGSSMAPSRATGVVSMTS